VRRFSTSKNQSTRLRRDSCLDGSFFGTVLPSRSLYLLLRYSIPFQPSALVLYVEQQVHTVLLCDNNHLIKSVKNRSGGLDHIMAQTTTEHDNNCCKDCQSPLGRGLHSLWKANNYPCANNTNGDKDSEASSSCQARLCTTCYGKHPLIRPKSSENSDNDDPAKGIMKHYCKACFEETSTIDFSKTYDVIQGNTDNDIVWVFAHGASGSRQLFRPHAEELNKKFGHASILWDLPGHSTCLEKPLTLESSQETLESILKECEAWTKEKKLIYVGGSLGAYIGFYLLDKLASKFAGAVLMDCGQNVGPGACFKARAGLVMLNYIGKHWTNATLMQLMLGELKKSKADYHLMDTCFGSGMFFDQAEAHVTCLKSVAPAEYIPKYKFPVLFMNGSEDYRDSEHKWLELCAQKEGSELKVYEGGDHFFSHDSRFVDDILDRMTAYAKKL